jgi:hypothetical protein
LTRDAEHQKYSEIAALVSVTVGREQFRNAEPRFYTAWTHFGRQRQTAEKPRFGLVFAECWSLAYNRNRFPEAEIAP